MIKILDCLDIAFDKKAILMKWV